MHCPYCQFWIAEQAPSCPSCGLNASRADALLGTPPELSGGVEDMSSIVSAWQMHRLRRKVAAFQREFPQVVVHVCIGQFPTEQPFELYAFWLFNRGAIGQAAPLGAENFDILLVLDPTNRRAATMLGYGWENLMSRAALQPCWAKVDPYFRAGKWYQGFIAWLDFHRAAFKTCWQQIQEPAVAEQQEDEQAESVY
jgi:uncharacterized membrane protein YgcG